VSIALQKLKTPDFISRRECRGRDVVENDIATDVARGVLGSEVLPPFLRTTANSNS